MDWKALLDSPRKGRLLNFSEVYLSKSAMFGTWVTDICEISSANAGVAGMI
jgi:hypothetical protein